MNNIKFAIISISVRNDYYAPKGEYSALTDGSIAVIYHEGRAIKILPHDYTMISAFTYDDLSKESTLERAFGRKIKSAHFEFTE